MVEFSFPTYRSIGNYQEHQTAIFLRMSESILSHPAATQMIDAFGEEGLYDQLLYHQRLVLAGVLLQSAPLMIDYLRWRHHLLECRGIDTAYLNFECTLWKEAIQSYLFEAYNTEFQALYDQFMQVCLSLSITPRTDAPKEEEMIARVIGLLLGGDEESLFTLFDSTLSQLDSFHDFSDRIIKKSMERIGMLWEEGVISVAKEHLATAIIERLCYRFSLFDDAPHDDTPTPLALIVQPEGQLHTMGARLVRSVLEHRGFRCAQLPLSEYLDEAENALLLFHPALVVCTVSLPIYLPLIQRFIDALRENPHFSGKIAAGGQALYRTDPPLQLHNVDFQGESLHALEAYLDTLTYISNLP